MYEPMFTTTDDGFNPRTIEMKNDMMYFKRIDLSETPDEPYIIIPDETIKAFARKMDPSIGKNDVSVCRN